MKKIIFSALLLACVGFGVPNFASAEQKIAIIDIQSVIAQSPQINALQKEQEVQLKELEKWIETAKKDIEKQKTTEGKEKLFNKYQTTFNEKKNAIINSNQTKLQKIMDDISNTIASQAKAKGYTMVIAKNAVIYGGDDITNDVQNAIAKKK